MEKWFAGVILALCVVGMLRLVLPAAKRRSFDVALSNAWFRLRERVRWFYRRRALSRHAAREADAAIRRARGQRPGARERETEGQWSGNVYTPKSFKKPRKPH